MLGVKVSGLGGAVANGGSNKSQMFGRKSELPHNQATQSALEKHKQISQEFSLTTGVPSVKKE
jgi:hypothetical protein